MISATDVCIVFTNPAHVIVHTLKLGGEADYEHFAAKRSLLATEGGVSCFCMNIWRCLLTNNSNIARCSVLFAAAKQFAAAAVAVAVLNSSSTLLLLSSRSNVQCSARQLQEQKQQCNAVLSSNTQWKIMLSNSSRNARVGLNCATKSRRCSCVVLPSVMQPSVLCCWSQLCYKVTQAAVL